MDIFNRQLVKHLESELEIARARILKLEIRLDEVLDAKLYSRKPERLTQTLAQKEQTGETDAQSLLLNSSESAMSDALSVAEEDAWERCRPKTAAD